MNTINPDLHENSNIDESNREKFVRLVEQRMDNALDKIRLIGNLSSKSQYEYTAEDVDKICVALHDAVDKAIERYQLAMNGKSEDSGFKL